MPKFSVGDKVVWDDGGAVTIGRVEACFVDVHGVDRYDTKADSGFFCFGLLEKDLEMYSLWSARTSINKNSIMVPSFAIGDNVLCISKKSLGSGTVIKINATVIPITYVVRFSGHGDETIEQIDLDLDLNNLPAGSAPPPFSMSSPNAYSSAGVSTWENYTFDFSSGNPSEDASAEKARRKKEGLCPECGEKGRFHHCAMVCSKHGEYK